MVASSRIQISSSVSICPVLTGVDLGQDRLLQPYNALAVPPDGTLFAFQRHRLSFSPHQGLVQPRRSENNSTRIANLCQPFGCGKFISSQTFTRDYKLMQTRGTTKLLAEKPVTHFHRLQRNVVMMVALRAVNLLTPALNAKPGVHFDSFREDSSRCMFVRARAS